MWLSFCCTIFSEVSFFVFVRYPFSSLFSLSMTNHKAIRESDEETQTLSPEVYLSRNCISCCSACYDGNENYFWSLNQGC